MYSNIKYHGKTLGEWQKDLHYEFTLGELYRMKSTGELYQKLRTLETKVINRL